MRICGLNRKIHWLKSALTLYILCSFFVLSGCTQDTLAENTKILQICGNSNFSILSGNTGTEATGTILVYDREEGMLGVRIISSINVGVEDWGGVAFYLPAGCSLGDIMCTYPETNESIENNSPIEVWYSGSDDGEFDTVIEIGRSRDFKSTGGGSGTVVIDASYVCGNEQKNIASSLKFSVECGARLENGNIIWGDEHNEILVAIE